MASGAPAASPSSPSWVPASSMPRSAPRCCRGSDLSSSVCSPSRSGLRIGVHPARKAIRELGFPACRYHQRGQRHPVSTCGESRNRTQDLGRPPGPGIADLVACSRSCCTKASPWVSSTPLDGRRHRPDIDRRPHHLQRNLHLADDGRVRPHCRRGGVTMIELDSMTHRASILCSEEPTPDVGIRRRSA